jgi:hypothetical protein
MTSDNIIVELPQEDPDTPIPPGTKEEAVL